MNNLLIIKFKSSDTEVYNLQKVGASYQFLSPLVTDAEVGSEVLRQQLLKLALRKSGMEMPQKGEVLNKLMHSVDDCRRELQEYDSEITLPDGCVVEIEQYEYQNAVIVHTNRLADNIRKAIGSASYTGTVVLIADNTDVSLLRSMIMRNFASIGDGRPELEWLLVNDSSIADKAIAEALANQKKPKTSSESSTRGQNKSSAEAPASDVEGTYNRKQTSRQRKPRKNSVTPQSRTASGSAAPKSSGTTSNNRNNGIVIVILAIIFSAILAFCYIGLTDSSQHDTSYADEERIEAPGIVEAETVDVEEGDIAEEPAVDSDADVSTSSMEKKYDYIYSESKGLRKVEKRGKYGFIDSKGKEVVSPMYDYIYSESGGLYQVEKNGKKGFINSEGKVVIPVKYDYIYSKSDGMYKVELNNKKGFVDAMTGKEVCAPQYDYIYSFSGGLAKVEKDGKTGYINRQGKLVQPME